eukprot:2857044-Lingulodinium_polyedra.AAC.1
MGSRWCPLACPGRWGLSSPRQQCGQQGQGRGRCPQRACGQPGCPKASACSSSSWGPTPNNPAANNGA